MSVLSSHHTVWIHCGECDPHPERYALDGERLVAFGDGALAHVPDGATAAAAVHEIAVGPPLTTFGVRVQATDGNSVDRQAFLALLDHVPLGRDATEIDAAIERHAARRVLVLEPIGPTA